MTGRFLTLDELRARKGADRVDRLSADPAEQDSAITRAEEEAASYLSVRYPDTLPTTATQTPEVIKATVADAALYHLAIDNRDQVAEELRLAYEAALRFWRDVTRHSANLNLATRPPADLPPEVVGTRTVADLVFGNGGLDPW